MCGQRASNTLTPDPPFEPAHGTQSSSNSRHTTAACRPPLSAATSASVFATSTAERATSSSTAISLVRSCGGREAESSEWEAESLDTNGKPTKIVLLAAPGEWLGKFAALDEGCVS